jgi:hypothetical protein
VLCSQFHRFLHYGNAVLTKENDMDFVEADTIRPWATARVAPTQKKRR